MSWLHRLYQTYDNASQNEEIQAQETHKLRPYYHVNQNVQIIVTINDKGEFVKADVCRDDGSGKVKSSYLVIPATNDSATRSGTKPPAHPLSDKIKYLAKDFFEHYEHCAVGAKHNFHTQYIELLSAWCHSKYAHPKAQAVLSYVQKGTLVQDLLNANVLIADPDDANKLAYPKQANDYPDSVLSLLNKNSSGLLDQGTAFIAWRVVNTQLGPQAKHGMAETWRDETLFDSWQQFYVTLDSTDGFCYVTGKSAPLASKHPNRILRSATKAKLISANGFDSFTFLGRFTDDRKSVKINGLQAANISAIVTEKAHATLSWLLDRQGREEAGQAVVAWAISGELLPQPTEDIGEKNRFDVTDNLQPIVYKTDSEVLDNEFEDDEFEDDAVLVTLEDIEDNGDYSSDELRLVTAIDDTSSSLSHNKVSHSNDIGRTFATHLNNTLQDYRHTFKAHDQISIITLESATPGRMAVTYYHEKMLDDYINALEAWYSQFAWYATYKDPKTNEYKISIIAPVPKQIAQVAYGSRLSDALQKQVVSQVLPCIVEGEVRQFPRQLVDLCIKRACNPLALENWEWEQAVRVTCGLYRGYYLRQSGYHLNNKLYKNTRSYTVALQPEYSSRDYLYGRLLAVAEDIESFALYIAGEKRSTTAQRYMQQFANRPFSTWRNIKLALVPYEKQLKSNCEDYLINMKDLLDQIMYQFELDDYNNDSALSGEFLLGYHSQKMQFKIDKKLAKKARKDKQVS